MDVGGGSGRSEGAQRAARAITRMGSEDATGKAEAGGEMVHIRAEGKGAGREAGKERGGDAQGNEDGTGGGEARAQGGRSQATGTRNAEVGAAQDAEGALVRAEERQAGRNEMGKRKWRPAEDGATSSEERAAGTTDGERDKAGQSHEASDGARTPRNAAAIQHSRETQLNAEYTRKTEGVSAGRMSPQEIFSYGTRRLSALARRL